VPVAFSCVVAPSAIEEEEGSTAMLTMTALETVRAAELFNPPILATNVTLPTESDLAEPDVSILATPVLLLVHTTDLVTSFVDPSFNISIALNCTVCPSAMLETCGVICSCVSWDEELPIVLDPPHPCSSRLRSMKAVRSSGVAVHGDLSAVAIMYSGTSGLASTNGLSCPARKTLGQAETRVQVSK
jgi:hypothetical protein